jgi:NAD(P)-dependent dehydrogenase (short-subunit alcohol dehydrogenase family)
MGAPVVPITGAPTGIGRSAAIAFAKAGNPIVISGRNQDTGKASIGSS